MTYEAKYPELGTLLDDNRLTVNTYRQVYALLDEADALLAVEPQPGENVNRVAMRHTRAQLLLLRAQSVLLRGLVDPLGTHRGTAS